MKYTPHYVVFGTVADECVDSISRTALLKDFPGRYLARVYPRSITRKRHGGRI